MSFTRKEIYKLFSERGIFLPTYKMDQVEIDLKERLNKGEALFGILYSYEKDKSFNKYIFKEKGQYVLEPEERRKRAIIMIDDDGTETYFDSIYAAAKHLGLTKNSCGNISKSADGKTNKSYNKTWKWAI